MIGRGDSEKLHLCVVTDCSVVGAGLGFDQTFFDDEGDVCKALKGALNTALDEAAAAVQSMKEGPRSLPATTSSFDHSEDLFEIHRNTDGSASILFPGGGIHTVTPSLGVDSVEAFKTAYGDRISGVTSSGMSAIELAAQQQAVRVADELATVSSTMSNQAKYVDGAATGFDPVHVRGYLESIELLPNVWTGSGAF